VGSHYAFEFLRENTIAKVVNGYMRNLFLFNMITLDGFFEGPERDINWHTVDDEFDEFAVAQLNSVDTLLFGRVTYELMASYWPTPSAIEDDPLVAGRDERSKENRGFPHFGEGGLGFIRKSSGKTWASLSLI
jgi:hypothetical protein